MNAYLLPSVMGLILGLLLHWTGFSRAENLRLSLGLHRGRSLRCCALRSGLTALGWSIMLTALLCWLAVIDVDTIEVLPLSLGAILGGMLLGIAAGLCGFTPMSAFAGLGGGNACEALSVLTGCFLGTLLLSPLQDVFQPLHTAAPYADATLFRVTLDEPFLLAGSFLGQGCIGLVLAVIALCVPSPRPKLLTDTEISARAAEASAAPPAVEAADDPSAPDTDADESAASEALPDPEDVSADTFVALLEGEEPLTIDTALDEEAPSPEDENHPE